MPASRSKQRSKTKGGPVHMSRIDFEICEAVYQQYLAAGMNDEEVSFLLGKPNKYVFQLLDPGEKNKFKSEQLDILPTLLGCSIRQLVSNNIPSGEMIWVHCITKQTANQIIHHYTVEYPDKTTRTGFFIKKIVPDRRRKLNPQLHKQMIQLLETDYFITPKYALEVYLHLKEKEAITFSIDDLYKSIAVCLRDPTNQLSTSKENARIVYLKS